MKYLLKSIKSICISENLPFFLSSGFPFFTVATIISPDPAAGRRFNLPLIPWTAMT